MTKESLIQPFSAFFKKLKDGDKTIWMVLLFLVFMSIVSIFSSTSLLAIKTGVSRFIIFRKHLEVVAGGFALVLLCMLIPYKWFRWLSQYGFAISLLLLVALVGNIRIGDFIKVSNINNASRAISVGGFSLQVYEVVKVAMVMYMSWAVFTYEKAGFVLTKWIASKSRHLSWVKGETAERWIYIFLPLLIVTLLIYPGSFGSAVLTCIVMVATLLVGGMKWGDIIKVGLLAFAGLAIVMTIHIASNGTIFQRVETPCNRIGIELPYPSAKKREQQRKAILEKKADPSKLKTGSKEWYDYIDQIKQPASAELALVQGGRRIVGKFPGRSTQKYVVPVMFEDYMYSFIVEEYGLFGCLFIIILYMSLFARGMIIVHHCDSRYSKACVGGLVFLISFQAFFHIFVNCNIGPVTGQTLPMISHGRCSFLCFSIAFGIILSISEKVRKKIRKQQKEEAAILAADDISAGVSLVEDIDTISDESNN